MPTCGGISKLYIIHVCIYLLFCFTGKVRGTKTEKSDVATYGGRIHVYIFHGYGYLDNVSFLDWREQARVSVKRGYLLWMKSYISSTVMYLDYILFYWHPWRPSTTTGVIKRAYIVLIYVKINISQICTFWNKIQGYHLTQFVWRTRIIFRFLLYVAIFHLLQRQEDVGICWNQLQLGFPWSIWVTHGL